MPKDSTAKGVDGSPAAPPVASSPLVDNGAGTTLPSHREAPRVRAVGRRRWLALGLLVLLIVAASVWYLGGHEHPPRYRVARVERGPLIASISATGNLNAVTMVLVGSQVSGTIKELDADFNTPVRKGQIVARIDPALFEAAVDQARADVAAAESTVLNQEAQVEQARTNVENARASYAEAVAQSSKAEVAVVDARRTLERQTALFQRDLVAAADRDVAQTAHDSALAQHESAQAHERALSSAIQTAEAQQRVQEATLRTARNQVKQKQAALAQAQINLDHTTIRSPVDGVVVNRAVDVGQTVAATLQAPTLFTIARDITKMQVETSVDEADIGRLHGDTPVVFTVDAFPGETFTGVVSQIRKAPQVVQNVVTYTVVVAVPNPTGTLLPGMTANVRFVAARRDDVLKVPNTALRFRPPSAGGPPPDQRPANVQASTGQVWALEGDRPVAIPVALGITDGTFTEVVSGNLSAGQDIIVGAEEVTSTPPVSAPRLRL
jgi:HlyD family secretion protein